MFSFLSLVCVFCYLFVLSDASQCVSTNLGSLTTYEEQAALYNISYKIHCLITNDGYHLNLVQVYDNKATNVASRQPVLLQHGIAADALAFISNRNNSLAYFLVRNGFNVWISNARGSKFSRFHNFLKLRDNKYWNFSFHEMGMIDLPAILEYIYEQTTKQNRIIFIGHSMGTSIAGVYSSTLKDHAKKYLKKIVVISPVIFMKNTRGLLPTVAPLVELILQKLQALGLNRLFVKGSLERIIVENICVRTNKFLGICNALVNYFNGPSDQKPRDFSKEFLREWPDDVSVKTLRHFAQTISSGGKAPLFNYGAKYNNYLYKSSVPPEYDISGIQIPFHIVYGGRDSLAPKEDAELLYNTLTSEKTIHGVPHFNHVDFMFANNVVNDFFVYLLELLNK